MKESDNKPKPVSIRSFLLATAIVSFFAVMLKIVLAREPVEPMGICIVSGLAMGSIVALVGRLLRIQIKISDRSWLPIFVGATLLAASVYLPFPIVMAVVLLIFTTPVFWELFGWIEPTKPDDD